MSGSGGGPLLQVRDLGVSFSGEEGLVRAVDRVSLEIGEGEALGLVGESGCGKTVTALSLLRLLPPSARLEEGSEVRLRGRELTGLPEAEMRRIRGDRISMVFQEPMTSLNPVLTVGRQVAEVLEHHRGMGRREARAESARLLAEAGLPRAEARLDDHPHRLSGGERQRVLLAMALACRPDLLVADEPTTALDVTVQARILERLAELRRSLGMALLLITHDLGVVAAVCDRVAVMYAGEIVEEGSVEDVLRAPRHPYTRGLLDSLPSAVGGGRLRPIPGSVPPAGAWPEGCRFRDRCPHAREACGRPQALAEVRGRGGRVRCVRAPELGVLR